MYLYMVCCSESEPEGRMLSPKDSCKAWESADKLRKVVFSRCYTDMGILSKETAEICLTGRLLDPEAMSTAAPEETILRGGEDALIVAGCAFLERLLKHLGIGRYGLGERLCPGSCCAICVSEGKAAIPGVRL